MSTEKSARVLLVAPPFFGYDQDIKQGIEMRGVRVDLLPDRPFDSPTMRALTKLRPAWILPAADRLYEQLLEGFGAKHYDAILVVNGQTLSSAMRRRLRQMFPAARQVLYMWDSLRNRPGMISELDQFDATFSFDRSDASGYGMTLRPLFFGPRFELAPQDTFKHHISFVGTAHTDRFAVVDRLRRSLPAGLNAHWYLYLQARWVFHWYKLTQPGFNSARLDDFQFQPLSKPALSKVFADSRAVLDIEHPLQRGLTMRTFETLGAHKKLVSTNPDVREYDFYDARNICVIDREAPRLPEGFLESPSVPLPSTLYRKYSLAGWLDDVLGPEAAAPSNAKSAPSAPSSPGAHA